MRTIQSIRLILSLGVGLSLAGCGGSPPEKEPPIRPVKIHTVGSLEPAAMREFPGTIRAFQTAEMGFEVAGRVTEFKVLEGDSVKEGDVLARLDARDYEANLKVAQANLDKAISARAVFGSRPLWHKMGSLFSLWLAAFVWSPYSFPLRSCPGGRGCVRATT